MAFFTLIYTSTIDYKMIFHMWDQNIDSFMNAEDNLRKKYACNNIMYNKVRK